MVGSKIVDGLFVSKYGGMTGTYDIVVTMEGYLKLGTGHYYLSNSAPEVMLAGTIEMYKGKVKDITNLSGHYLPNAEQTKNYIRILNDLGARLSGATLSIYKVEGNKKVLESREKID
ncbi:hypothetical protein FHW36_11427 [Chitinophaga polysaccharea]|uniref:Uncharacterized protein n=2 Tax=Chitinophaga polysaccharea TaxID=1293035 RepID=A0A561P3F0_9BACT|nr:hypothetical protein FHW36_11427 [Chitinophaga polysaccharea]